MDQWLEQMAVTLRPGILEHYQMENHVKPCLGTKLLTHLTAADLRKLCGTLKQNGRVKPHPGQGQGLSSTTIHGIHTTLHHTLKVARDQGLIPINPADEVDLPKVIRQPMKILNEEQLNASPSGISSR
ncbi:MAG: site-specific integrase [Dysosmobacter sp.]|nr:site-specific integrase [Dysosmobacter sp.]